MLDAIKLPDGYFDRRHFMYYEDLDLGWRARLAGWSALYVPSSIVLHRWHGSSDRHGKAWLAVISKTNRIRTLLKNASVPFMIRTSPRTVKELAEIAWYGRLKGLQGVATAVRESAESRRRVAAMTVCGRESIEATWRAAPA
jgi:GT2 family glycosyltransferase